MDENYALAHAGLANLYDTYVSYGISMIEAEKYEKYNQLRITESERAYTLDSSLPYVNEVRGHILLNTRADLETVYKSYLKAYHLDAQNPDLLLALMDVYFRKGLIHDALQFVNEVLVVDPLHTWAHAWKAYLLGVLGDFKLAITQVKRGLDINPDEIVLLMNLASFYSFLQKNKDALQTYERINQINPNYLASNPYYQIKLDLLKGKATMPKEITHQPSAALLPIGNIEIDYLSGDLEHFQQRFQNWWSEWKVGKHTSHFSVFSYTQSSIYLHLKNHLMYRNFRNQAWFEEIVREERVKFDRYLEMYMRPEQLLKN